MKRMMISAAFLLLAAGLATFLILAHRESFTGSRTADATSYALDAVHMNGSDRHALSLVAGDILQVHLVSEKGMLHLEIQASDGAVLYAGNGKATTDFTLRIPADGVYTVTVQARHAKGTLTVRTLKAPG